MAKTVKKPITSAVKEPEALYISKSSSSNTGLVIAGNSSLTSTETNALAKQKSSSVMYWLGENLLINNQIKSDFDLVILGAKGIPKSSVDKLATHLGISRKSMAEDILDLSVKTLERKAPSDKLDKRTSSHALEIAKVMQHAYEVFEDEGKIKRWISKENRALNGMKPLQLLDTLTGLTMVNDILGRIEEGVYS